MIHIHFLFVLIKNIMMLFDLYSWFHVIE